MNCWISSRGPAEDVPKDIDLLMQRRVQCRWALDQESHGHPVSVNNA